MAVRPTSVPGVVGNRRDNRWPYEYDRGVYLWIGEAPEEKVLHVGMTGWDDLGGRLYTWFGKGDGSDVSHVGRAYQEKQAKLEAQGRWKGRPRYLFVVRYEGNSLDELSSLEKHLIFKLQPPYNDKDSVQWFESKLA